MTEGVELAKGLVSSHCIFVAWKGGSLGGTLFYCKGNSLGAGPRASACGLGIQSKYIKY